MTQSTDCAMEFEVTDVMRLRYAAWVEAVTTATGMPAAELVVDHEPWVHPLDAIATLVTYTGGGPLPVEDRPAHRDALRTSAGLGDHDRLGWVAYAMGVSRETVKRYDPHREKYDLGGPSALYRYHDERGRLLYVGIAKDPDKREREHAQTAEWHAYAARREVEWFDSRHAALEAERAAIRDELPVFNRLGSRADPDEAEEYLMMCALDKVAAEAVLRHDASWCGGCGSDRVTVTHTTPDDACATCDTVAG